MELLPDHRSEVSALCTCSYEATAGPSYVGDILAMCRRTHPSVLTPHAMKRAHAEPQNSPLDHKVTEVVSFLVQRSHYIEEEKVKAT
ncbi:hypothetical protein P7K49_029901 [Saguinus oedipus]|uniref:Uncharacterized protein n=1 Tax=Saguinus oedipus TaxID=9490 RepID=A0ABQ9U8H8_SAGOE|nr:hypothetical protein P7K49_029901 [Saguinus oedipus]